VCGSEDNRSTRLRGKGTDTGKQLRRKVLCNGNVIPGYNTISSTSIGTYYVVGRLM
jgi:hypothetical protein